MIQSSHHHIMPDECTISNIDATLILQLAPAVKKDMFSYMDILSAIRMKRRKQAESIIRRVSCQMGK